MKLKCQMKSFNNICRDNQSLESQLKIHQKEKKCQNLKILNKSSMKEILKTTTGHFSQIQRMMQQIHIFQMMISKLKKLIQRNTETQLRVKTSIIHLLDHTQRVGITCIMIRVKTHNLFSLVKERSQQSLIQLRNTGSSSE